MKKEELAKFEKIVEEAIEGVEKEKEKLKSLIQPISPDRAIGRLSRLEAINDKSIQEANLRKLEGRLLKLIDAKNRVKSGEFGNCLSCEEPIPQKRLKLVPESTLCIECIEENTP